MKVDFSQILAALIIREGASIDVMNTLHLQGFRPEGYAEPQPMKDLIEDAKTIYDIAVEMTDKINHNSNPIKCDCSNCQFERQTDK